MEFFARDRFGSVLVNEQEAPATIGGYDEGKQIRTSRRTAELWAIARPLTYSATPNT